MKNVYECVYCLQVSCSAVHRRTLWYQATENDGSGVQRCFPRQASDGATGTRSRTTAITKPAEGQDHHQGRKASLENPAMSSVYNAIPSHVINVLQLTLSYSTRN